jgi:hypothetical protein
MAFSIRVSDLWPLKGWRLGGQEMATHSHFRRERYLDPTNGVGTAVAIG